jgi:predicted nucleic acid-binding Zn ribbon protein
MIRQYPTGGFVRDAQGRQAGDLFCSSCLAALKPAARFCPQCGRAVESQPRRRRKGARWAIFIVLVVIVSGMMKRATHSLVSSPQVPAVARTDDLTRQVSDRITGCSREIDQLNRRSTSAQLARNNIARSIPDIANFDNRLKTAVERADDEARWPVHVAGRTFDRPAAISTITRLDDYLTRANLALGDHDRAISNLDQARQTLARSNNELQMLRVRLQTNLSGSDRRDADMNFRQIDAEMSGTPRQVSSPAAFNPVDLDSLLK